MKTSVEAFNLIAADLGVLRYEGETDFDFGSRVVYTAMRFMMGSFCLDDGVGGDIGASKASMTRKIKVWLEKIEHLLPGCSEWFDIGGKGIPRIYHRLINVGDFQQNGFTDKYVACKPHLLPSAAGFSLVAGIFDASDKESKVCGISRSDLLTTGLAFLAKTECEPVFVRPGWWETDLDFFKWTDASRFGELEYADYKKGKWGLGNVDVWGSRPEWIGGLTLARIPSEKGWESTYFLLKKKKMIEAVEIDKGQAQRFYSYAKKTVGNPSVVPVRRIDASHVWILAPVGLIPSECDRVLDVVTWPVGNVHDRERIVRIEAFPLVSDLLKASDYYVKEVRDA